MMGSKEGDREHREWIVHVKEIVLSVPGLQLFLVDWIMVRTVYRVKMRVEWTYSMYSFEDQQVVLEKAYSGICP